MRITLALTFALTDARGLNEKGRPVSVAATGATRGEHPKKPTGVSGCTLAPVSLQRIRVTGHMKLASTLSLGALGNARYGADNERSADRQTNPSNFRSDRRLFDPLD